MASASRFPILAVCIGSIFYNGIHAEKHLNIGELTVFDTSNSQIPKTWIYTITAEDSGKVWAGSWEGGLGVFDGVSWKTFSTQNSGLPSNRIFKIAFDHNDVAWIGTDSGLVKYDGKTWTVYSPKNSPMKLPWTCAIAVDKSNNVWFNNGNNNEGGLMCLSGDEWKLFAPENSKIPTGIINDILVDSGNTVWVGTEAGLVRIAGDSWTIYDKSNSILPYSWVDELCLDFQGKVWIGESAYYSSELYAGALLTVSADGGNWSINNPSQTGKASRKVTAIARDKRGYMWVATSCDSVDYAVSIFNKKQWLSFSLSKDDTSRPYYIPSIGVDKNNNIWFATDNGIAMLKQDTLSINSLFAKEGVGVKSKFIRPLMLSKRETAFYDLLGRKRTKQTVDYKTNGVVIGFDNTHAKKIAIVK